MAAFSPKALKALSRMIRRWTLHRRKDKALQDLAAICDPYIHGWITMASSIERRGVQTLKKIDVYVIRWARRKFKRLRRKDCQIFRIIAVEHDKVRNEFDAYCLVQH